MLLGMQQKLQPQAVNHRLDVLCCFRRIDLSIVALTGQFLAQAFQFSTALIIVGVMNLQISRPVLGLSPEGEPDGQFFGRTDAAFKKGIFGAPTFIVNGKMFWGQDRLEFVFKESKK